MSSEFSVRGKTFLITGAASGLGAGFAEKFLNEGAKHISILDVAVEVGKATAEKLKSEFGADSATFYECDVTDERALTETFGKVIDQLGTLDVVINNAGILDDSPSVYRRANDVNWQALVTLSVLARNHMRLDTGGAGGTIVNISSVAALRQSPLMPIYSAAKAAVLLFSSCLGMEENFSRTGVRVLSISFGQTSTPLMEEVDRKCMDEMMGSALQKLVDQTKFQSVEGAVNAMVTVVKHGASGSAWLARQDEPVRDITPHLRAAYAEIAKAFPGVALPS